MNNNWTEFLTIKLTELINSSSIAFFDVTPSKIPQLPGVYLITEKIGEEIVSLYIGRSKDLQQRLYTNHLMGDLSNARLKKYLIDNEIVENIEAAKSYIKGKCYAQWITEYDYRKRGALEGYFTGILFPKYGIAEEH